MIQDELNLSNDYIFDTIDNGRLVAISQRNVAIAEAMIRNDSKNIKMYDVDAGPNDGFDNEGSKAYQGSSAFWFTQLGKIMNHEETQYDIQHIIKYSVNAVDRENSTHLNADRVGRTQIFDRIMNKYNEGVLFDCLRNPGENYLLIEELSSETKPQDPNIKGRKNISFASKFCHYAAFYMFNGEEQDNFSIWDNVLRKAVPLYMQHYHLDNNYDLNNYPDYQNVISDIINSAAEDQAQRVSRNGFDHLLWYYHRGRR